MKQSSFWKPVSVILGLLALAAALFWVNMPYPVSVYFSSWKPISYPANSPITQADFRNAQLIVRPELKFPYEFISAVIVDSSARVTVSTMQSYKGNLAAGGRAFYLEKKDGRWRIVSRGRWHA